MRCQVTLVVAAHWPRAQFVSDIVATSDMKSSTRMKSSLRAWVKATLHHLPGSPATPLLRLASPIEATAQNRTRDLILEAYADYEKSNRQMTLLVLLLLRGHDGKIDSAPATGPATRSVTPTDPHDTANHRPVARSLIVQALLESLGFRKFEVVADSDVVSRDTNRMFAVLEINEMEAGVGAAIAVRNSTTSFALGRRLAIKVFYCSNFAFHGDFTPVTRRHSKNLDRVKVIDIAYTALLRTCRLGVPPQEQG